MKKMVPIEEITNSKYDVIPLRTEAIASLYFTAHCIDSNSYKNGPFILKCMKLKNSVDAAGLLAL